MTIPEYTLHTFENHFHKCVYILPEYVFWKWSIRKYNSRTHAT